MAVPKLRKGPGGVFYAYWSEGRRSRRASMGAKDEVQAQARFAHWLIGQAAGGRPEQGPLVAYTIADLWGVYLDKHVGTDDVVGKATIGYAWKNLEPHFGHLRLDQLGQNEVDAFIQARMAGRTGRPSKPVTIRRELLSLMAGINFCAKPPLQIIEKTHIPFVKLPHAGEPRDRWLRVEEIKRLLDAARELRIDAAQFRPNEAKAAERLSRGERFLWLAIETAARKQAILDLEWSRVDFEAGVIFYDVPGRKKTKKSRAAVAMSASLRPVLERAYAQRVVRDLNGKVLATHALVLDNGAAVWPVIQKIATRAGFSAQDKAARGEKPKGTGISPHVLRHSAATLMARRGVSLWKISRVLGNTMAVVEKTYGHWVPDDPTTTVDLISGGALGTVFD